MFDARYFVGGQIAYFDVDLLHRTPGVTLPAHPVGRSGPFLCLTVRTGASRWVALTSQPGVADNRIPVRRDAVIGAVGRLADQQYIAQVRGSVALYSGPLALFAAATAGQEGAYVERRRPFVLPFGLVEIEAEIAKTTAGRP